MAVIGWDQMCFQSISNVTRQSCNTPSKRHWQGESSMLFAKAATQTGRPGMPIDTSDAEFLGYARRVSQHVQLIDNAS
jgi:hypothetical protein